MKFGPIPARKIPSQNEEKIMLIAQRYQRAAGAHAKWAEPGKKAVDFLEGRQWSAGQIAAMAAQRRPALTFNIIAPLVRLIIGYQTNNRTDIQFKPGNDSLSSEDVADVLTQLEKSNALANGLKFVDTEMFMDGIVSGRGFYRTLLDFENNDLGECVTRAEDPFNVVLDPDGDTYDLNASSTFTNVVKYVSVDEIEATYGKAVADLIRPYTSGRTPLAPVASTRIDDEISPVRSFGAREDGAYAWWDEFYGTMGDFVDVYRKTIRVVEHEHYVSEERNVVIDLETGDKKILPKDWGRYKIEKILLFGEQKGNPLFVQKRRCRVLYWTTMCGDVLLYDRESPFQQFSLTGYFPYFRRGVTRGAVEDLIDPQIEKNKRRSAEIEAVSKMANGGWMYEENTLSPDQEARLRRFGSTPGFMLKYKGTVPPQQIQPSAPPMAHERLEAKSDEDVRRISGINESALGEIDKVQSGRAIEARQRQAVISLQLYLDNFTRTKTLLGAKRLSVYQNHYTEPRIYRILGEDGAFVTGEINQRAMDPTSGAVQQILNDITIGQYSVTIDERPLSATFASAQFDEMMMLLEKMAPMLGPALPMFADLVFESSSIPRKDEWVQRLRSVIPTPPPAPPGMAPMGQPGVPPQQLPPGAAPAGPPPQQMLPAPPPGV